MEWSRNWTKRRNLEISDDADEHLTKSVLIFLKKLPREALSAGQGGAATEPGMKDF